MSPAGSAAPERPFGGEQGVGVPGTPGLSCPATGHVDLPSSLPSTQAGGQDGGAGGGIPLAVAGRLADGAGARPIPAGRQRQRQRHPRERCAGRERVFLMVSGSGFCASTCLSLSQGALDRYTSSPDSLRSPLTSSPPQNTRNSHARPENKNLAGTSEPLPVKGRMLVSTKVDLGEEAAKSKAA